MLGTFFFKRVIHAARVTRRVGVEIQNARVSLVKKALASCYLSSDRKVSPGLGGSFVSAVRKVDRIEVILVTVKRPRVNRPPRVHRFELSRLFVYHDECNLSKHGNTRDIFSQRDCATRWVNNRVASIRRDVFVPVENYGQVERAAGARAAVARSELVVRKITAPVSFALERSFVPRSSRETLAILTNEELLRAAQRETKLGPGSFSFSYALNYNERPSEGETERSHRKP